MDITIKPKYKIGDTVEIFSFQGVPAMVIDIDYNFSSNRVIYRTLIPATGDNMPTEKACIEEEILSVIKDRAFKKKAGF